MMTIAICDDEKILREILCDNCLNYGIENNIDIEVIEFSSGEEVLAYRSCIDLLFLDIGLPGMDGVQVKNCLLERDNVNYIIFASSYTDYMSQAFSKKTLGFINKPFRYENICEKLQEYRRAVEADITIDISTSKGSLTIKVKNIICINAQHVYTEIVTEKELYLVRESLNEWENHLKEHSLIRISKSSIVNLQYIRRIEGGQATLDNGTSLKIGRTKRSMLINEYRAYSKRNAH